MYRHFFKRLLDIIISFLSIIVLLPLFLVLSILVKIKLGSPIIFKQKRPGKDCKIFTMYKFRTMTNKTDELGNLLPDKERLTTFGIFLRKTSLDELPELFNIFIGDMSFVGPRPLLIKDLVFFSNDHIKRQLIRPGLTGWAQINGRNNISWEDKFKYDLFYFHNYSVLLDIKILFFTFIKVVQKADINTTGFSTAEDYGDYLLKKGCINELYYNERVESAKYLDHKS